MILPTASKGIFGAVILAFGRALGETMALAMLAGNANKMSWSLFAPTNTLAALLANNFGEATEAGRTGADVRRPGAAGHHIAGQYRRSLGHSASDILAGGESLMVVESNAGS